MSFEELAASHDPQLDRLALAIAAEFREVDEAAALERLDAFAEELTPCLVPVEQGDAVAALLGRAARVRRRRGALRPSGQLNNLVASFGKHGDLANAIRAAELRLLLPIEAESYAALEAELRSYRARLN